MGFQPMQFIGTTTAGFICFNSLMLVLIFPKSDTDFHISFQTICLSSSFLISPGPMGLTVSFRRTSVAKKTA